jgi:hypothetical protein
MDNQGKPNEATVSQAELTKEIVAYLSKEIETTSNSMMVFRSRISFAVLVGPFLILGTLVYAAKGLALSRNLGTGGWIAAVIVCVCYLALAFVSGRIEEDGWRQCNVWRKLISELQQDPNALMDERNVRKDKQKIDPVEWMKWSYLLACALLITSFGCLLFILSRVQSSGAPEAQQTTITVSSPRSGN